jgi:threonyl-tRNA synthetase
LSDVVVTVTGPDREAARTVTAGTKAWELVGGDDAVVAARVNGDLVDLSYEIGAGDVVEPVGVDSDDGRAILRHSTAHVLAQAVQQLFPDAKLGIGPPIVDGFYYDFDVPEPFRPDDLEAIATRMRKIIKDNQRFVRREVSDAEATSELADEPYKLELVALKGSNSNAAGAEVEGASVEVGQGQLSIYDNVKRDGSLAW